MKTLALLLLAALPLAAQTPAAPPPAPAPIAAAAPHRHWLVFAAAAAGATTGAVLGARAVSFASVDPADRGARQFRSGLVYGAIGGVLPAAVALRLADGPHGFFWDRWNTPLLAGMVAVHVLDYTSTRYFRDRGKDEWLLTNSIVDSRPRFIATEAAAAAAGIGLVYIFHRTGHHRLERWVAAGYISLGAASAVANYRYPSTGHAIFGN